MKKIKHVLFILIIAMSAFLYYLTADKFGWLVEQIPLSSQIQTEITIVIIGCLQAIFFVLAALFTVVAFAKLQYKITYKRAFLYQLKKYPIAFMALPSFIFCCVTQYALSEYIDFPYYGYTNPLYNEALFGWCYNWGSLLMLITLLLWLGVLTINLFGCVKYAYCGINILSAIGLISSMYVAFDIISMSTWHTTVFLILNIVYELLCIALLLLLRGKNIQPALRPFFALAEQDEEYEKRKKRDQKQFLNRK